MNKKQQLYYLIQKYLNGEYDTKTFCSEYYNVYVHMDDKSDIFSNNEEKVFRNLLDVVGRFSEFEEEIINNPNMFYSEEEIYKCALDSNIKLTDS